MKTTTMVRRQVTAALALALLLALFVPAVFAQSSGTSGLAGTVTDPSGAAIPGVTVTLTSNATGQTRTSNTGADGTYKFTLLQPGDYKVRFAANGFKTAEVASITLNVTETPALDRTLEVGAQSEQITVEAAAETLQTQSSTLGTVVSQQSVQGLPLASRNYTQILGLEAGANSGVNNATALGKGTLDMAVNGNSIDQNNFQMDGISVVNAFGTGIAADSGIYVGIPIPNPDAIQEFKVQTSTYDASYGRNPGANVNVVTRSGSNSFHGSLFEFFRNSDLDANNFFYNRDNLNSSKVPQVLKQNQFGGSFGGPLKKDKLFFFGSYQGTRQRDGIAPGGATTPILPPIPAGDRSTPAFQAALGAAMCPANHPGNPAYLTGFGVFNGPKAPFQEIQVACDGSNISQVAMNILRVKLPGGGYYMPGSTTGGFQQANYSLPSIYTGDQYIANVDYLLNSKNTLAMRYFYTEDPQQTPFSISTIPGTPSSTYYANTDSSVKLTTLVTNTFVNELHASLERNIANGHDTAPYTNQQVGITGIVPQETLPPAMVIIGAYNIGGTLAPFYGPANQIQYGDQISWSHGKHTIRAGYEFEFAQWNLSFASLLRGFLISPGFPDWLIGRPGCGDPSCFSNYSTGTTGAPFGTWLNCLFCVRSGPNGIIHGYRERNMNAYVQDDWKVNAKLTVNIGVRWEYDGVFADHYGNLTNVWPSLLSTVPNPPTTSQPSGASLIGYVVPSNFAAHYGQPPAGVTTVSSEFPTRNSVPLSNFGPRIGFAWQPMDKGKLVIRGGAGLFYDRVGSSKFVHAVEQGDPYALTLDYGGPGALPYSLANPFPSTPLGFSPRYFNPATGANSSLNTPFYETIHTPLTRQYNLGFQYEFLPKWVLEVGYVGSNGINQANYNHNYNLARLASPTNPINGQTTNTTLNAVYRVPYLGYQPIGVQGTEYDAAYHYDSLQATVRKQFSHGLTLQAAFTWSKDLTEIQQCFIGCVGDGQTNSNDPSNLRQQLGPAAFSHPQRFVLSYNYELPFGHPAGFLGKVAEGWSVSGTTIAQNGTPLTFQNANAGTAFYGGANPNSGEGGSARAQLCPGQTYSSIKSPGGVESRLGGPSGGTGWINSNAFCAPPVAPFSPDGSTLFGDSGIGIILGPGQVNYDISLLKVTTFAEHQSVQFRAEFFNAFNHPQFNNPVTNQNTASTFGVIQSTSTNARVLQFALKYLF